MVSKRIAKKKQQTRLTFTPVSSSSPAAPNLPPLTENRLANVRYDLMESPTKRRRIAPSFFGTPKTKLRVDISGIKDSTVEGALPTPEPSSQIEAGYKEDYTALPRFPTSSSSDEEGPIIPRRHTRPRAREEGKDRCISSSPASRHADGKKNKDRNQLPSNLKAAKSAVEVSTSDESEALKDRTLTRKKLKQQSSVQDKNSSPSTPVTVSSDGDSDATIIRSTRRSRNTRPASPEALPNITPTRSSKRLIASKQRRSSSKESSEDVLQEDCHSNHSESESNDSSDSLMNELKSSTRKQRHSQEEEVDDSENSSDDAIRSSRRGQRSLRRRNSSSITEIYNSDHGQVLSNRNEKQNDGTRRELTRATRPPSVKSTRQKQLELLRRRRAGEDMAPESDEELEIEPPAEDQHADPDSLDELDQESSLQNGDILNLDEYEEDFIEDGDDTLGAPLGLEDIPLEFTRHAHKKPVEYFKDVVEWMVHNKLNPAFARNDQIYVIARYKLDDAVQGFAGSKFISAAWKADFAEALKKFPDIEATPVETMFDRSCEACGRSGHPAKHQLVFKGKPYHRESLEDVSSDEDSGEEDDDDSQNAHTPQSKAFFLGRTCNANAEMAHALHHWRHHLNQFVLQLLRAEGHTSPEKILEREGWSVKKKEKYANRVVDGMEQDGRMRELYREFKENLEAAREVKNEVYSYGR